MPASPEAPAPAPLTGDWPLVGHQQAIALFRRALAGDQLGHAYLLTGPSGIGRGTLARTVAQALVCTGSAERPCGVCSACRRASRGLHPDIAGLSLETQGQRERERGSSQSKNTRVSIEAVREFCASLSLRPLESPWRVAILEDVERFSREAYDALLKTLEEPPPFVVLLLVATEPEAVPETIRSRCRPVALEPLGREEITAALVARGAEAGLAAAVARYSRGRIGDALKLIADEARLETRRQTVTAGLAMIEDPLDALLSARQLAESFRRGKRDEVTAQVDALLGLWRDLMLTRAGCATEVVNADVAERIAQVAEGLSLEQVRQGLRATYEALNDLAINVQPRLALDRMVTQWPRLPRT